MAKNTTYFFFVFIALSFYCFCSVGSSPISSPTVKLDKGSKCSLECEEKLNTLESKIQELQSSVATLTKYKTAYDNLISDLNRALVKTKNDTSSWSRFIRASTATEKKDVDTPESHVNVNTSCSSIKKPTVALTATTKKHKIFPYGHGNKKSLEVLCDFQVDDGGWTIIQKREYGEREEFNRGWDEYSNGFGSLNKNFWLGLDNIHALTKNGDQELRIELEDFQGKKAYAKYSSFSVSDASDFYRLSLNGYSGNAGDSLSGDNGVRFSTKDMDNDDEPSKSCAVTFQSGWWFKNCGAWSNLNGLYRGRGEPVPKFMGILWEEWTGYHRSLAKTEIKIRTRR